MPGSAPVRRKPSDESSHLVGPSITLAPSRVQRNVFPALSRFTLIRVSVLCIVCVILSFRYRNRLHNTETRIKVKNAAESSCKARLGGEKMPSHLREERLRSDIARLVDETLDTQAGEHFHSSFVPPLIGALDHVQVWQLTDTLSKQQDGKKLVALVELKNVEPVLPIFLKALGLLVDSIVVLDDRSSDGSRVKTMEAAAESSSTTIESAASNAQVELLINKTGDWVREELLDRNLLLHFGRFVGGTHFVLPDYDEFFSANCVLDGTLREAILTLEPGQSLVLPWVEAWKSTAIQRVLPDDPEMNFLKRRQTIIFADDGRASYSVESANSRSLGNVAHSDRAIARDASIHVLRCPRTLCPAPIRYKGPNTPLSPESKVKTLPQCRIVELRFLSPANVLLKAAWYEALGRVMGADDSVTRGKMLDAIYPNQEVLDRDISRQALSPENSGQTDNSAVTGEAALARLDLSWLQGYHFFDERKYSQVELWRARDIIRWRSQFGDSHFLGLPAYTRIDMASLSSTVQRVLKDDGHLLHVPHLRKGTFVVALDEDAVGFLEALGAVKLADHSLKTGLWVHGPRLGRGEGEAELLYESWRKAVLQHVYDSVYLPQSKARVKSLSYCSAVGISSYRLATFLDLLLRETPELDVVALSIQDQSSLDRQRNNIQFASSSAEGSGREVFSRATTFGSNLRYLVANHTVLGSVAGISVLCERLLGASNCFNREAANSGMSRSVWERLVSYAEDRHYLEQHSPAATKTRSDDLPPVSRLVFSLNVGRSGSNYLASVFNSTCRTGGVVALHEPSCPDNFCSGGGAVRMQDMKLSDSYDSRLSVKRRMIRQSIAEGLFRKGSSRSVRTVPCKVPPMAIGSREIVEISNFGECAHHEFKDFVYSETNPNFKAWFFDIVLDTMPVGGYSVDIIVLRRYIPAVVQSLYQTGYFSGRDGYNWMETANGVNSMIEALDSDDRLDAYDKLISYVFNAEARARHVMRRYSREARFVEIRSEEVFQKDGTMKLLQALDLTPSEKTLDMAGVPVDKYRGASREQSQSSRGSKPLTTLADCERRVQAYLDRCSKSGISLPEAMVHMDRWPGFQYHA